MNDFISQIRNDFISRLESDSFQSLSIGDSPNSIQEFIDFFTAGDAVIREFQISQFTKFPELTDLRITFAEFLKLPVVIRDRSVPVERWFKEFFCHAIVCGIGRYIVRNCLAPDTFIGMNSDQCSAYVIAFNKSQDSIDLALELGSIAAQRLGARQLISFYIKQPTKGTFAMWGPNALSGEGRKLPTKIISGVGYSVSVSVSRYEDVDGPVSALEWHATLTLDGNDKPDAACCGMVYVFERTNGVPIGDLDDLILASDSVADSDVIQVRAFIDQQPDATFIIRNSDLAFVWIWDRRAGSESGLGAKCIDAALGDLKRRFKKINTVVFDARPAQFMNWGSRVDPPMVATEKQAAIESLVAYLHALGLDFDVRSIFARADNEMDEALLEIGRVWVNREDGVENDGGDENGEGWGIDFEACEGEIIKLLNRGGYYELAADFEEDMASIHDVSIAINHMVFDPYVHFIRPTINEDIDISNIGENDTIPFDEAFQHIPGVEDLLADLPMWMRIESVFDVDDQIICRVSAATPIGKLVDHFTLVPKAKPFNIEQFFRSLDRD